MNALLTALIITQAALFLADHLCTRLAGLIIVLQMRKQRYATDAESDQDMRRRVQQSSAVRWSYAFYAVAHWYVWLWHFLRALVVAVRRCIDE